MGHRVVGFIWNHLFTVEWLPVLITRLCITFSGNYAYVDGAWWCFLPGLYGGMALGMILHELSHAAAVLNYGGTLCEVGIMIHTFMPGAYCMMDFENVKDRFRRAQFNAAGAECNMLLPGCFLCLLKSGVIPTEALLYAAGINVFLGLINLSLIDDLDGNGIFEKFMGCR